MNIVSIYSLCKSVGIMLIFYDSVNRASQKQEFRSQWASEPARHRDGYQTTRYGEIEWYIIKITVWLNSFLTNRFQRVVLHGQTSSGKEILAGAPQGSTILAIN